MYRLIVKPLDRFVYRLPSAGAQDCARRWKSRAKPVAGPTFQEPHSRALRRYMWLKYRPPGRTMPSKDLARPFFSYRMRWSFKRHLSGVSVRWQFPCLPASLATKLALTQFKTPFGTPIPAATPTSTGISRKCLVERGRQQVVLSTATPPTDGVSKHDHASSHEWQFAAGSLT